MGSGSITRSPGFTVARMAAVMAAAPWLTSTERSEYCSPAIRLTSSAIAARSSGSPFMSP